MSFAKAKRFNYKDPDIRVSPADYNISWSLAKGYSMPKCARFQEKKDDREQTFVCSRLNCSKETHSIDCFPSVHEKHQYMVPDVEENEYCKQTHTSPDIEASTSSLYPSACFISNKDSHSQKASYAEANKKKVSNFERSRSIRKSSKRQSFRNSTPKMKSSDSETLARSSSTEPSESNRMKMNNVIRNQQFIDDDYHSLTSSDEYDHLRKIDQYEFQAVRKVIQEIHNKRLVEEQSKFENLILKTMENIECNIEEFKENFAQLNMKIQAEQLQKHEDLELSKVKNATVYFDRHMNQISNEKLTDLKNIIAAAIENLRRELENKRKAVLRDNEVQIRKLIDEIQSTSNNSAHELKQLCNYTASDLTKNLISVLNVDYSPNNVQNGSTENLDSSCSSENHECFNYENICKVLSEHLQLTQDEKDALEQDNLDITLKYGDTKEALESQASLINILRNEITALKDHVYKRSH